MKKFLMIVAVAAVAMLADSQLASARRGGCGGGRGGHGGHGGCGGCGGGYMMGGCGMGGCGMGYGGGYMMGGCMTCGGGMGYGGGYVMGGGACAGGVCTVGGGGGSAYVLGQGLGTEATIVVKLPEDATLTIDGEATSSTSAQRVFVTPSLEQGKEYEYTLKAEVVRDGKSRVATAKVTIRPGETSQVELKIPAAGVAAQ